MTTTAIASDDNNEGLDARLERASVNLAKANEDVREAIKMLRREINKNPCTHLRESNGIQFIYCPLCGVEL